MKIKNIFLVTLFITYTVNAQIKKCVVVDINDNEKLNSIKILDKNGNIISVSDVNGIIEVDLNKKFQDNAQIETSNFLYETKYLDLLKLPDTIKLERKIIVLKEVVVSKTKDKYYKIKAYFRSWKLVNNKLQNYAEGLKDVLIPIDKSDKIKNYFTQYITLNDSLLKKKKTYITFGGDGYLFTDIYIDDYYSMHKHLYKLNKSDSNSYDLIEEDRKVGYVKFDENNQITEVNKKDVLEDIKLLGKEISYRDYVFEKWNNGINRHLSYSRNTIKKEIKSKNGKILTETVTEIYVEDEEFDDLAKPTKSKGIVDKNKSFYNYAFYDIYRKKYPLEKEIEVQLKNFKLNENSY